MRYQLFSINCQLSTEETEESHKRDRPQCEKNTVLPKMG